MPSKPASEARAAAGEGRLGLTGLVVGLAFSLALLVPACAEDKPSVRMRTETTDATRSGCKRDCDRARQACLHQKREGSDRKEVDGPQQVSQEEWKDLYKQAQELARKCEEDHRDCTAGCLE